MTVTTELDDYVFIFYKIEILFYPSIQISSRKYFAPINVRQVRLCRLRSGYLKYVYIFLLKKSSPHRAADRYFIDVLLLRI